MVGLGMWTTLTVSNSMQTAVQEIASRLSFQKLMAAPIQYYISIVLWVWFLNANWTTYLQSPVSSLTRESVSYFSCPIPTLPITIAPYLYLGGACPPHWVFQGFIVLGPVSGGNGGWGGGGWWDHPPALATLGKMALGTSVGFLGIGRSD